MTPTTSQPRATRRKISPRRGEWRARDILRATLIVAGVFVALLALWVGRSIFLLGFFGVLLGLALSAGVDRLQRYRIPRGLGAALLVLAVGGSLVGLGFLTAPQISGQMREVRDQLPQAIDEARGWVQQRVGGITEMLQPDSTGGERNPPQEAKPAPSIGQSAARLFTVFSSTLSAIAGLIVLVFVSIFVASEPDLYHRGLMHLFPHQMRAKAGEVLSATATTLRRWLMMQFLEMIMI
jgi:predicted PurR-regulated permease PerM